MDIQVVDYASPSAPSVFTKSLKETGFAVLTNHPVEEGLIEEVYDEWREFLKYIGEGADPMNSGDGTPADATLSTLTAASTVAHNTPGSTPSAESVVGGELRFGNLETIGDKAVQPSGVDEPMFSRHRYEKALEKAQDIGARKAGSATENERASKRLCDKYLFDPVEQDGYFPMAVSEVAKGAQVKDLKHYYHYFPEGRYPSEVSQRAKYLSEKMLKLGKQLVQWIDDDMSDEVRAKLPENMLSDDSSLVDWISDTQTLLRILHYPAYKSGSEQPGAVRAAAHGDINTITVLPAGSTKGLQVKCPKSGSWFEVPCIRGSLVINIGDMLQECTQREYISTMHRVVKPEKSDLKEENAVGLDRMATPCFIHFKPETYLSEKYPTAEQFLHERLRELGVMK